MSESESLGSLLGCSRILVRLPSGLASVASPEIKVCLLFPFTKLMITLGFLMGAFGVGLVGTGRSAVVGGGAGRLGARSDGGDGGTMGGSGGEGGGVSENTTGRGWLDCPLLQWVREEEIPIGVWRWKAQWWLGQNPRSYSSSSGCSLPLHWKSQGQRLHNFLQSEVLLQICCWA